MIFTSIPVLTSTVGGTVPTPPNNTTTFLRGDATFALPGDALIRVGGTLSEVTTVSTTAVSLLTAASMSIGVSLPVQILVSSRKTSGAATAAALGLMVNATATGEATLAAGRVTLFDAINAAQSKFAIVWLPQRVTLYNGQGVGIGLTTAIGNTSATGVNSPTATANIPLETITDIVIRGISTTSVTLAADELHVYTLSTS